jgi:predicted oxidoreductase
VTRATPSHPALLYGCMGLTERAQAEAAIEAALDAGITVFDHADIYGDGQAETVFGEVLKRSPGLRDRITIQTKCGIRIPPGLYDLRGASIVQRVEASLERLGIDALDVLLLHRPDPLAEPDEIAEAFGRLHAQGKVREFGVSNMSRHQIAHLQVHLDLPLVANQIEMSLHRRDWLEADVAGTLEHCQANGIALQAWGSLAQGRYSGRPETPADHATAGLVARLATAYGTTAETIVLWWLQRHPARIAPVIGTTSPARIRNCGDAAGKAPALTHEEWYELWVTARGAPLP